ncbi:MULTISPECIES: hypothetical protein [Microcystis]|jgi:hypothetical protein|nr:MULTISPECIES: hypothetical protein [Microcystis]
MSNNTPKLLDVIALTIDLPVATRKILDQLALDRGQLSVFLRSIKSVP